MLCRDPFLAAALCTARARSPAAHSWGVDAYGVPLGGNRPNRGSEVPGTSGPCEDRCVTEDNGRQIVAEQLYATLKTNHGNIEVRLFPNHAPKTVKNFVGLATGEQEWTNPETGQKTSDKLYDGTVFHRVISGFMLQGGDPLGNGTGGPGYQFADEFHPDLAFNKPYLLAMANAGPGTNGSQFFITVAPTAWLTGKHTIFGEVEDPASQKVVDEIAATQTNPRTDRPVNDVVIESVVVENREG